MSTELTEAEFPYTERPAEQEFAVVVAALLAGRIDGQQALASLTALHERILAARFAAQREQIAQAIEALHPLDDCPACNYGHGLRDAARIARGDA